MNRFLNRFQWIALVLTHPKRIRVLIRWKVKTNSNYFTRNFFICYFSVKQNLFLAIFYRSSTSIFGKKLYKTGNYSKYSLIQFKPFRVVRKKWIFRACLPFSIWKEIKCLFSYFLSMRLPLFSESALIYFDIFLNQPSIYFKPF